MKGKSTRTGIKGMIFQRKDLLLFWGRSDILEHKPMKRYKIEDLDMWKELSECRRTLG
jgi:hypothetical protein